MQELDVMSAANTTRHSGLDTTSTTFEASASMSQMPSSLKRKRSSFSTIGYGNLMKIETGMYPRSPAEAEFSGETPRINVLMNLSALRLRNDRASTEHLNNFGLVSNANPLQDTTPKGKVLANTYQALARPEEEQESLALSGKPSGGVNSTGQAAAINAHTLYTASDIHDVNALPVVPHDPVSVASGRQIFPERIRGQHGVPDPPNSRENLANHTTSDKIGAKSLPFFAITSDLVWSDAEITGHDPDDPEDDGYGINGIGYKPTPSTAERRRLRRQKQIAAWNRQEDSDQRIRRREIRNKAQLYANAVQDQSSDARPPNYKKVRFLDSLQK